MCAAGVRLDSGHPLQGGKDPGLSVFWLSVQVCCECSNSASLLIVGVPAEVSIGTHYSMK